MSIEKPESGDVTLQPVSPSDFEALVAVRIAAMRESLERVGRFDPARARERLRQSFTPEHTQWILRDNERVGFCTFRPAADGFHLDHLYVLPECQSRGVGGEVLRRLLAEADRQGRPVRVGALKESGSNRFYQRHGFSQTGESEWDIYYVRVARDPVAAPTLMVREIQAGDWAGFKAIRLEALRESPQAFGAKYADEILLTDEQWQNRVRFYQEDAGTSFMLGFIGEVPVAMAGAYRDKAKNGVAHLYSVWTAPAWRGKGVTMQLIEPLADWARANGLPIMEGWVTTHNERALGFYRKAGFAVTTEFSSLHWDPAVRQVLIRRALGSG